MTAPTDKLRAFMLGIGIGMIIAFILLEVVPLIRIAS